MAQLNERQRKFAEEYIKDGNATKAALSAGYSEKTAPQIGYGLLKLPHVAAEIARLTGRIEKKTQATADRIMEELSSLALCDISQAYTNEGKLKPLNEIPDDVRRALQNISDKGAKFSSKLGALEMLAKIHQMVKEQQTQQQAVQIIIAPPPKREEPGGVSGAPAVQLLPEWE